MSDIIASTYEIKEVIGSGGGGTVFLARHLRLDKDVVLKADKRKITTSPELLRREVNVLKDLRHAHIPQVYDYFVENDTVYTVIDYIKGESLDTPLKRGERFSQAQVIQWARQLLDALVYLHSPTHGDPPKGYVHSDIKPANLMRLPNGDICLIDFNIALAIGEENLVGLSAGYASPEHYGLDYSSVGLGSSTTVEKTRGRSAFGTQTGAKDGISYAKTELDESGSYGADETARKSDDPGSAADAETEVVPRDGQDDPARTELRTQQADIPSGRGTDSSTAKRKRIVPDVRSDIYSVGATLYHLLSGVRPAKDALEVVPLSKDEFSPLVVDIITKAMNPNPDLRYQTAAEMLEAFNTLRVRDPRVRRLKKQRIVASLAFTALFALGVCASFVGLKRIQTLDSWAKLVEYSKNALTDGDTTAAVDYALQALPEKKDIFTPPITAAAQEALTSALGVYELSGGYQAFHTVELPSAPLCVALSPEGSRMACVYASNLAVFDMATCEQVLTLPADRSALSEVEFLTEDVLVYAGADGVTAYDLAAGEALWSGEQATAISISADGTHVAAVNRDETHAKLYDAKDGSVVATVDFGGLAQSVAVNDVAINPRDNLFELNDDGTMLAVSFSDGSLQVLDIRDSDNGIIIYDGSAFTHFEGGFFGKYLAFSSTGKEQSAFVVIDTAEARQTGGFSSTMPFHVRTDGTGIYVSTENILVKIDPESGEQEEVAYTDADITGFCKGGDYTIVATADDAFSFFGVKAVFLEKTVEEMGVSFVSMSGSTAVVGSSDTPTIRVLRMDEDPAVRVLSYDPTYTHSEARISADGKTVMLYRYDRFRIYDRDGKIVADVGLPNASEVYDQQFRRDECDSWLEVTYNDGLIQNYSAKDGSLLSETQGDAHDGTLYEEYETDKLRIEAPLHGAARAYDRDSGELVATLEPDAYLAYVTQIGEYVLTEYITTDAERYGLLLNDKCEVLARMPQLCDALPDGRLIFDDTLGNLRQSRIFTLDELISQARFKEETEK